MKLTDKTIKYMNSIWGFETCEQLDDINMFWECGYYEIVAKRLVKAGAVESNCPEAAEMIAVAKTITDKDINCALDCCMDPELPDYVLFECIKCGHCHYINNLYLNDYINNLYFNECIQWNCSSCNNKGLIDSNFLRGALDAGIPRSVILSKTKLKDHFSAEYIDFKCETKNKGEKG